MTVLSFFIHRVSIEPVPLCRIWLYFSSADAVEFLVRVGYSIRADFPTSSAAVYPVIWQSRSFTSRRTRSVHHTDTDRGGLEDAPQPRLALPDPLLVPFLVRDILKKDRNAFFTLVGYGRGNPAEEELPLHGTGQLPAPFLPFEPLPEPVEKFGKYIFENNRKTA